MAGPLARLPAASPERRDLLADTAYLDTTRAAKAEIADEMAALAEQMEAARNEVDDLTTRQQLGEGRAPEAAVLAGAQRHAGRAGAALTARPMAAGRDRKKRGRRGKRR